MENICDAFIETPFGSVGIQTSQGCLLAVKLFPSMGIQKSPQDDFTRMVLNQIQGYLINPNNKIDLNLNMIGTNFQKNVWTRIAEIPVGQTQSYSDLAISLGSGPRAVANACGANNFPLVIPCHRVVAKAGLGGFMQNAEGGMVIKRWLIDHEKANAW